MSDKETEQIKMNATYIIDIKGTSPSDKLTQFLNNYCTTKSKYIEYGTRLDSPCSRYKATVKFENRLDFVKNVLKCQGVFRVQEKKHAVLLNSL